MSFAGRSSALEVRRRVRRCMGHWKPGGHPSARGAAYPGCATPVCSAALQDAGYIAVTSHAAVATGAVRAGVAFGLATELGVGAGFASRRLRCAPRRPKNPLFAVFSFAYIRP
jgi:hypothetical protein